MTVFLYFFMKIDSTTYNNNNNNRHLYLTIIIPRGRIGYEMIDSQRGAERRVGYNHLISNKHEWNNCFIKNSRLNFVKANRKRQRTCGIHMSHVYQNCQRLNGLAWTG